MTTQIFAHTFERFKFGSSTNRKYPPTCTYAANHKSGSSVRHRFVNEPETCPDQPKRHSVRQNPPLGSSSLIEATNQRRTNTPPENTTK